MQALTADPGTRLVALADAFEDHIEKSVEILKKNKLADRIDVDSDHRFAGFDCCQKLVQSGVDVVLLAAPPHFRPRHLKMYITPFA